MPEAQGRAGFVNTLTKVRTAFPDLSYTLEDVIADGDRAVLRVTGWRQLHSPINVNYISPSGALVE